MQGYWQVPLLEESKPIAAFTIPNTGLFEFTVMNFGLHSAPATFQRLLDMVIGLYMHLKSFAYLDYIIVFIGKTFEEYKENLRQVFSRFKKLLKCVGHVVGENGVGTIKLRK